MAYRPSHIRRASIRKADAAIFYKFSPLASLTFGVQIMNRTMKYCTKYLLPISLLILCMRTMPGQCQPAKITDIKKVADGFYLMYYDTTAEKKYVTKSAIVEFKNYVVLLEMPISYNNTRHLKDFTEGGKTVLDVIKKKFPNKPLKYVISSHYHPHSISSIVPFISSGVKVVTTHKNFERLREMIDSTTYQKYHDNIIFVEGDSMVIKDKYNTVIAYKCDKDNYPNISAPEFLYAYAPKYGYLQTSCMYQRLSRGTANRKEMVSPRVEDLDKFLKTKHITPQYLLCTETFFDGPNGMTAYDTMREILRIGVTFSSMQESIYNIPDNVLILKSDSVIKYMLKNNFPLYVVNKAVYAALAKHELSKALAIARLQVLFNPSDANVWDTYGEVYYIMGDKGMAKMYEWQSKQIDKTFNQGGEKGWETELADFQKKWQAK